MQDNKGVCWEDQAKPFLNQVVGFAFHVNKLTLTKKPPLQAGAVFGVGHMFDSCLTFEIDQFTEHFIGGGDDSGVGLKTTLGGDHFDELGCQVDGRLFQGVGEQAA